MAAKSDVGGSGTGMKVNVSRGGIVVPAPVPRE